MVIVFELTDTTATPHGVASLSLESAPVLFDTGEVNSRLPSANGKTSTFMNDFKNRPLIAAVQGPPHRLSTKMNATVSLNRTGAVGLNLAGSISIGLLSS
jgi:hypothetical protein